MSVTVVAERVWLSIFFFSSRRRHTRFDCDWSSDVCSSDLYDARGIAHVIGRTEPHGLLDDNIQAAAAFLDAYEATGEDAWLTRALAVVRHCVRVHWDETDGGFSDLARDRAGAAYLATPAKPIQDAPTPSANGVAALVLARAAAITDHPEGRPVAPPAPPTPG